MKTPAGRIKQVNTILSMFATRFAYQTRSIDVSQPNSITVALRDRLPGFKRAFSILWLTANRSDDINALVVDVKRACSHRRIMPIECVERIVGVA